MSVLLALAKGRRGHPLHPPFTDATIGACTVASALGVLAVAGDYVRGALGGAPLALTLIGFALLTLGGWLGGTIVFVYGMRVLAKEDEPALSAVSPSGLRGERADSS